MWSRYTDRSRMTCVDKYADDSKVYFVSPYNNLNDIMRDPVAGKIISDCENDPKCNAWEYVTPRYIESRVPSTLTTTTAMPVVCNNFNSDNQSLLLLGSKRASADYGSEWFTDGEEPFYMKYKYYIIGLVLLLVVICVAVVIMRYKKSPTEEMMELYK